MATEHPAVTVADPDRTTIAAAIIRSGVYDSDEVDLLQWHPCPGCPRREFCGCSGVPYISDEVWALLGPVVEQIRERGRAAGRKQAAADIRDAAYPDPSPCLPAWHAGYTEATETAARIAEGTDR